MTNFLAELDEWVEETGAVPFGGSWHAEIKSMLTRALAEGKGAEHNEGLVMADLQVARDRIHALESAINTHLAEIVHLRGMAKRWSEDDGGFELDKLAEGSIATLDHIANAWGELVWAEGAALRDTVDVQAGLSAMGEQIRKQAELESAVVEAARTWCFNDITTSMDNEHLLNAVRALEAHMGVQPVTDEDINAAW